MPTSKIINGELVFLDREPETEFTSGQGLEFSIVDNPSHKGANLAIARSDSCKYIDRTTGEPITLEERVDLVNAFTSPDESHQHGVTASIYNGALELVVRYAVNPETDNSHDHQVVQDGDNFQLSLSDGHTHTLSGEAIRSSLERAIQRSHPNVIRSDQIKPDYGDKTMSEDNVTPQIETLTNKVDRVEKENKVLSNPEQRAHYETLDDTSKQAFLDMDETQRAEAMKPQEEPSDNPAIAELTKRLDTLEKENKTLRSQLSDEAIARSAQETLKDAPGTEEAKQALIRAVETVPAEQKEAVMELVRSVNNVSKMTQPVGFNASPAATEYSQLTRNELDDKWEELARAEMKENKDITIAIARQKALDNNPDLKLALAS